MTNRQYERQERLKVAGQRERCLELLQQVEENADSREAAMAAGFWLQRLAPEGQRTRQR